MLKTPVLILKKQNYGETDRILTVFSPILGKKRVIARAVRRTTSKLSGHLDTMMLSQIMLTDETELPKVTDAVLAEPFDNIRNSLDLLERAYAVTKIVERVVVEDVAERPIFQLTINCLTRLNHREKWATNWLFFLAKLTGRLGLSITNFNCNVCTQPITNNGHWLLNDHKLICSTCTLDEAALSLEANSIKMLKLLTMEAYEIIARVKTPPVVARQIEEVYLRLITEWLNKPWQTYASLA